MINIENTTFSGLVSENTTWSGEILLTGSVRVPAGVSLIIEPGTQIKVQTGKDIMLWVDGGSLFVSGHDPLKYGENIVFQAVDKSPEAWLGIRINGEGDSRILHAEIYDSKVAIHISQNVGTSIYNSRFEDNVEAIWIGKNANSIIINDSIFIENDIKTSYENESVGPYNASNSWGDVKSLTINDNEFLDASVVLIPNQRTLDDVVILGNTFYNKNDVSLQFGGGGYGSHVGNIVVAGNEFIGGTGISVRAYSWQAGSQTIHQNYFVDNLIGVYFDFIQSKPDDFKIDANAFFRNKEAIRGVNYTYSSLDLDIVQNLFFKSLTDLTLPKATVKAENNVFVKSEGLIADFVNSGTQFTRNQVFLDFHDGILFRTVDSANANSTVEFSENFFADSEISIHQKILDGRDNFLYPVIKLNSLASPIIPSLWSVQANRQDDGEIVFDISRSGLDVLSFLDSFDADPYKELQPRILKAVDAVSEDASESPALSFTIEPKHTYWDYWYRFPDSYMVDWDAPSLVAGVSIPTNAPLLITAVGLMAGKNNTQSDPVGDYSNPAGIIFSGPNKIGQPDVVELNLPNGVKLGTQASYGATLIGNPSVGWRPLFDTTAEEGLGKTVTSEVSRVLTREPLI